MKEYTFHDGLMFEVIHCSGIGTIELVVNDFLNTLDDSQQIPTLRENIDMEWPW